MFNVSAMLLDDALKLDIHAFQSHQRSSILRSVDRRQKILLYNSFGLISKAAEDVASRAVKIHVFDYPTVV